MKRRERRETGEMDLFQSRLDQIINMNHELVRLAKTVSWEPIEARCGPIALWAVHAALANAADGGAGDPQAHVQSLGLT